MYAFNQASQSSYNAQRDTKSDINNRNMRDEVSFGEWLHQHRRMLDLTQQALADQVGCARITLRRIESGALKPSKELAFILLDKLGIPEIERPQWILFARGLSDFPAKPSKPLANKSLTNLPTSLTSFIGREKEQAEIAGLIAKNRLVTLTGSGGVGKTRLSLQVATDLLETFPQGAWLVELAPISDPTLVASSIAAALNLPTEVHRPVSDMLCDYLRGKELLIILDNCEHLVGVCAQMADRLLRAAPKLRILASSREVLGIAGEVSYRVPSLRLPDIKNLSSFESLYQYESVRLFIERATSAVSTFNLTNENASAIAQICRRLDGIPLAIELAAAKICALSAEQIAKHLDDRFRLLVGGSRTALERHQTLRAAMDWSYNLLPIAEQVLFRKLSVFVNGWTLEAAESVCSDASGSDGIRNEDIQNLLEHLVNKSLISAEEWQSETRYRMLETIRQYANEKSIEASESKNLRQRHLAYFLDLAETTAPHLIKPEQIEWLARLEAEHENMRAALEWSLGKEQPEHALRLTAALGTFWYMHCYWKEGAKWLERALNQPVTELTITEKAARAHALYQDANLADRLDNLERLKTSAEASLALCEEGTNRYDLAIARFYVARAFYRDRDYQNVRPLLEQSLAEFRELKDLYWEALSQCLVSNLRCIIGEILPSQVITHDLELARKAGERLNLADVLDDSAILELSNHQIDTSKAQLTEAEMLRNQIGFKTNMSFRYLGMIAHINNDFQQARHIYTKLIEQCELLGEKNTRSLTIAYLGLLDRDEGNLQQAQSYFEQALVTAKEVGESYSIGIRLAVLGQIALLQGNLEGAKRKFNESLTIANEVNNRALKSDIMIVFSNSYINLRPQTAMQLLATVNVCIKNKVIDQRNPFVQRESDSAIAQARQHLDELAFNTAWTEGEKMSLDEALELALKTLGEM